MIQRPDDPTTDLLPLSLGDVFDNAFDLYKRNAALFLGIVSVVQIPTLIVTQSMVLALGLDNWSREASDGGAISQDQALGLMVMFLLVGIVSSLAYVIQSSALTVAVSERYLGRKISIMAAYRGARSSILPLLVTWFLLAIGIVVAWIAMLVVAMFLMGLVVAMSQGSGLGPNSPLVIIMALIAVIVPMLLVIGLIVWTGIFVTQIVVIERTGFFGAIARNAQLVRGSFGRGLTTVFLLATMLPLLIFAVFGSVDLLATEWIFPALPTSQRVDDTILAVWYSIGTLLIQPYPLVCLTLLYYDQRVRREAFDLALLEQQLRPATAAASASGGA